MENQILDENVSQSTEIGFDERVANLLSNGYKFDLGNYISIGSKILGKNIGGYIAFLFSILIISIVCNFIPVIGALANSFFISPALSVGFAIMAYRISKNKSTDFGKFFGGFNFIGQLALLNLLLIIIYVAIVIPYILIALGTQIKEIMDLVANYRSGDEDPMLILQFFLSFIVKLIPLFFILLIVQIGFSFSKYILVFGKKGALEAITTSFKIVWKNFISFFLFFVVLFLINVAGAICLLVGLLYTVPLSMCAMYAAYDSIVGTNASDIED